MRETLRIVMFLLLAGNPVAMAQTTATPPAEPKASPVAIRTEARARYMKTGSADTEAVLLFQKAADMGDPLAVMWVAHLQRTGVIRSPADPAQVQAMARKVVGEVKRLAETGNPEAQFLWGMACLEALDKPANPKEGLHWLLQAAEKGDTLAMNNAGLLLLNGGVVPRDEATGVAWIEKAAQQDNYFAIGTLGYFYHWGVGVEPDRGKAREWYVKATSLGYECADEMRMLTGRETTHAFTADALRAVPYVKLFGTRIEDLPKVAVAAGIVPADAVLLPPAPGESWLAYSYKKNGILFVNRFGRIRVAELYAQGVNGFDNFKGQLPLGLVWDDTRESVIKKLGQPDDQGDVASDAAYGMAYIIDNLTLAVMFNYDAPGHVKLVRIMERWAKPQEKTPPAPVLAPATAPGAEPKLPKK